MIHLASFPVAGLQYHAGLAYADAIEEGDTFDLFEDRNNPHDTYAIEIRHMGIVLGYIPRPVNQIMFNLKKEGWTFTARAASTGTATVSLEGEPA